MKSMERKEEYIYFEGFLFVEENKNFKHTCCRKRCSVVCEFLVSADEVVEAKTEC